MVADVTQNRDDAVDDVSPPDVTPTDTAPDAPALDAVDDQTAPDDTTAADVTPPDAATVDVSPADVPSPDVAPLDVAPLDVTSLDAPSPDVAPRDVVTVDATPMDVALDTARPDVAPVDAAPVDTGPRDVTALDAADAARPPCGALGQPCCQNRVCTSASVCDTVAMRCVAYTPIMNECTATLRCTGGEICGGIYLCGDRPCLLCVMPGPRPLGAACTTADQCASDFCANGVCTAPCLVGSTGDTACAAMGARMICGQFTSRARADGGTGTISTFGGCVTSCVRDADCASGTICRLQRNDFEDRLDQVCSAPSGGLAAGAACDPNPPATATSAMFCGNSQCLATGDHTGYCAPFCAADADCPSSAYACITYMFGRPSGLSQNIRMCTRR
jgi:hypothetical protein